MTTIQLTTPGVAGVLGTLGMGFKPVVDAVDYAYVRMDCRDAFDSVEQRYAVLNRPCAVADSGLTKANVRSILQTAPRVGGNAISAVFRDGREQCMMTTETVANQPALPPESKFAGMTFARNKYLPIYAGNLREDQFPRSDFNHFNIQHLLDRYLHVDALTDPDVTASDLTYREALLLCALASVSGKIEVRLPTEAELAGFSERHSLGGSAESNEWNWCADVFGPITSTKDVIDPLGAEYDAGSTQRAAPLHVLRTIKPTTNRKGKEIIREAGIVFPLESQASLRLVVAGLQYLSPESWGALVPEGAELHLQSGIKFSLPDSHETVLLDLRTGVVKVVPDGKEQGSLPTNWALIPLRSGYTFQQIREIRKRQWANGDLTPGLD